MSYATPAAAAAVPVRLALIGCGWIGAFHARSLSGHLPGVQLAAVADPAPGAAEALATELGVPRYTLDPTDVLADPEIDGVVIASPAAFHAGLVTRAAAAGKHVFCEKPAGVTLEELDAALAAVEAAGVEFQIGFNRRFSADFAEAKAGIARGDIGTPQLMRSLTRDPGTAAGIPNAGRIKPYTIFLETLIHDFDTLNWFNEGARVIEVRAIADALVAPEYKDAGLLDTAVVTLRYDNGAIAVAEANFNAVYGYDVRGEVFGSAGMVMAGTPTQKTVAGFGANGARRVTERLNVELFRDAYRDELAHFAQTVAARQGTGSAPALAGPGARAARDALAVALACIESVQTGAPVVPAGAEATA